jgi:hypothetical protein
VEKALKEIRDSLYTVANENELLELIRSRLSDLRTSYRADKSPFTPEDIKFLKGLNAIADQLEQFVEAIEEASYIDEIDD